MNGGGWDAEGTWGEGRDVGGIRGEMVVGGTLSDVGGCGVCVLTPLSPPPQVRWLRGAVERWALGVREGAGAPPEQPPPSKPGRGPPEDPPEYAEIRVK